MAEEMKCGLCWRDSPEEQFRASCVKPWQPLVLEREVVSG